VEINNWRGGKALVDDFLNLKRPYRLQELSLMNALSRDPMVDPSLKAWRASSVRGRTNCGGEYGSERFCEGELTRLTRVLKEQLYEMQDGL